MKGWGDPREKLCYFSKLLSDLRINTGSEGNLSLRSPYGFFITPSGRLKTELTPKDIAFIDWDGKTITGKPSSEWGLHYKAYLKNPKIKAIIHGHPPYLLTLDAFNFDFHSFKHPEASIILPKMTSLCFLPPGSESLWEFSGNLLINYQIVILKGHGVVARGESLEEAMNFILLLEKLCQLEYLRSFRKAIP